MSVISLLYISKYHSYAAMHSIASLVWLATTPEAILSISSNLQHMRRHLPDGIKIAKFKTIFHILSTLSKRGCVYNHIQAKIDKMLRLLFIEKPLQRFQWKLFCVVVIDFEFDVRAIHSSIMSFLNFKFLLAMSWQQVLTLAGLTTWTTFKNGKNNHHKSDEFFIRNQCAL